MRVQLKVNAQWYDLDVGPSEPLVHMLRDQLGLTGTHVGCLTGHCGACTVLLNGHAVKACTVLAASTHGDQVETIEGLARAGELHPIQQAFWDRFGFQCGFCTPGMIMTVVEFLREHSDPDEQTIRAALSGNLCRCTGYQGIVNAVKAVCGITSEGVTE